MIKPRGYDQAPVKMVAGGSPVVPGAYILGIIRAECKQSREGNEMLELSLDIASGDCKGHYRQLSETLNRDCLLKHRRVTSIERALPYFKGDLKAIEESNNGYKFNFDERTLRGKFVGAMLSEEEYENRSGEIKTKLSIAFLCSIQRVQSGTLRIPRKKEINFSTPHPADQTPATIEDDDLPF